MFHTGLHWILRLDAMLARFCLNDVLLTGWGAQRCFCSRLGWYKAPAVSSWKPSERKCSGDASFDGRWRKMTEGEARIAPASLQSSWTLFKAGCPTVHFILRSLETLKGGRAQTLRWLSAWLSAQKQRVGDKVSPWECEGPRDLSSFLEHNRRPRLCSLTFNRFTRWSVVAWYDKKKDAAPSALPWIESWYWHVRWYTYIYIG